MDKLKRGESIRFTVSVDGEEVLADIWTLENEGGGNDETQSS